MSATRQMLSAVLLRQRYVRTQRRNRIRSLMVVVSALSFHQVFGSVGLVPGRASSLQQSLPVNYPQRFSYWIAWPNLGSSGEECQLIKHCIKERLNMF